jgi:hypothetical protein
MHPLGQESPHPSTILGTREHAEFITEGRHPGVRDALQWLTFSHLPGPLQNFSRPFYQTAVELIYEVTTDSPELTTALDILVQAKDAAVRAGIRHSTGRAGSVPRPQTVVNPPLFGSFDPGQPIPRPLERD